MVALATTVVLVLLSPVAAKSKGATPDLRWLDAESALNGAVHPPAIYQILERWKKLTEAAAGGSVRMDAVSQFKQAAAFSLLGFDPRQPDGLGRIGLDPSASAYLSLGRVDHAALARREKYLALALTRVRSRKAAPDASLARALHDAPPALVINRVALRLRDEALFRKYLKALTARVPMLGLVDLDRSESEAAPPLAAVCGIQPRAAAKLVSKLRRAGVLVFGATKLGAAIRVTAGYALIDIALVAPWEGALGRWSAAALENFAEKLVAKRTPLRVASKSVAQRMLSQPSAAVILIQAKHAFRLLEIGESSLARMTARSTGNPAAILADQRRRAKEVKTCVTDWARGPMVGDAALSLGLGPKDIHLAVAWQTPASVLRGLRGAVNKGPELIDPADTTGSLISVATALDWARAVKILARGVFKLHPTQLKPRIRPCQRFMVASFALGNWLGLISWFDLEARREKLAAAIVHGLKSAVAVVYDPGLRGGTRLPLTYVLHGHVDKSQSAKVKEQIAAVAGKKQVLPRTRMYGALNTTVYENLTGELKGKALSVADLPSKDISLSLGSAVYPLYAFLRRQPPKAKVLPPSILFFAQADARKLWNEAGRFIAGLFNQPPPSADGAASVERLSANVQADEASLQLQVNVQFK
jgi:hypothetical protein